MTYYLWFKQRGEGCDYTIGCGQCVNVDVARLLATIAARDAALAVEREWVRGLTEDNGRLIAARDEACPEHCRVRDEEIARLRAEVEMLKGTP